jgi:RNA polymerase sigma factor (sigma-70 family)
VTTSIYSKALDHRVLSRAEEAEYCTRYAELRDKHGLTHRKTIAARNFLVQHNLRMVAKMAKRYRRLPFEDLMGEGVKGLIIGVERFEVGRGWRLGTFATYWVRHSLQRACQDIADMVRVPINQQDKLRTGAKELDGVQLFESAGRSLDARLAPDSTATMHDVFACDETSAEGKLAECQAVMELRRLVGTVLNEREREIIARRYLSDEEQTLSEVGVHVGGVTRERVRQLQDGALLKLRQALARRVESRRPVLRVAV